MLQCWRKYENERPSFRDIYDQLVGEIQEQKGTVLAFALSQQFTDGRHSIGKFRLVVEQEVQDLASEKSSREALGKDSKKSRQ